jgi:hypothetical protein
LVEPDVLGKDLAAYVEAQNLCLRLHVIGGIPVGLGGPGYGVPGAVLTSEPIRGVS